jgi:hypothetical protein
MGNAKALPDRPGMRNVNAGGAVAPVLSRGAGLSCPASAYGGGGRCVERVAGLAGAHAAPGFQKLLLAVTSAAVRMMRARIGVGLLPRAGLSSYPAHVTPLRWRRSLN